MTTYIYDRIPYDTRAYPSAHPRNLAAIGMLYGLEAPPVEQCRVLVLGCAQGGNLFPAAAHYPHSHFVGLDNSQRQIEVARSSADKLGLDNISLHCMDIMDAGEDMGQFDYIIAHGIYSWIPEAVRDKVFQICKSLLSANGIAYLSYNTLPGWHINGIVRDIMQYRFRDYEDPMEGLKQALKYLEAIVNAVPANNNPYMTLIRQVQAQVSANNHTYLLHEYLSDINEAFHFHQVVEKGHALGLRYLADATFIGREFTTHSADLNQRFQAISKDIIDYEQHFDFVCNRLFRSSLFCHREVALRDTVSDEPLWTLFCSSMAKAVELPAGQYPAGVMGFHNGGGVMVDGDPLFQNAMKHLIDIYPQAMTVAQLMESLLPGFQLQGTRQEQNHDARTLYGKLLRARAAGLVNLTTDKPAVATPGPRLPPGYRPYASPFARLQAESGDVVVSAWNENVGLNPFSRQVLGLLDGSRRLQDLQKALLARYERGELALPGEGTNILQGSALKEAIEQRLMNSLTFFAKSGLLLRAEKDSGSH